METAKTTNRIHPLMAAAAVAVLLVSLTGVAAMTGLLPSSHSNTPAFTSPTPAPLVETKAASNNDTDAATLRAVPDVKTVKERSETSPSYSQQATAQKVCHSCGRVESIRAVQQQAKPSGIGVVAGAVLGGVLGNQVGGGNGRTLSTVAGAVGGGFAGNEVEKRTHTTTAYHVLVRMDDGRVRSFPQSHKDGWYVGEQVKVVNGLLTPRG